MDAEKRTLIKALPHTLVFHLKRFEWDYESYTRWKVGVLRALPVGGIFLAARVILRGQTDMGIQIEVARIVLEARIVLVPVRRLYSALKKSE